ncbi:MAG: glucose-1-phosphate cytidylyltransferase [Bacteroidales bacterium]|jgi:glucose-1-phosphate cytidylyltransferase|nr:glucose-1-phosphate cytidylyltransferase [Bacteroidales bacterium]MBP7875263.1 glucose-1-phosphate cytidylyltransferase [Bacteroidales bacterium]MCZ2283105.1 glucose-1-phosphate cytidylyltransferase [Bacteroidales bacterium]
MKVIILCGGMGTRLREETEYKPKPMVEIGGKPILWHIMKHYSHYGFKEFVLALGYKGDVIRNYFLNFYKYNSDFAVDLANHGNVEIYSDCINEDWKVTLVETGDESMTGYRTKICGKYITEDRFMLTYGDAVSNVDIAKLVKFNEKINTIGTVTGVYPPSRFGDLVIDGNKVAKFKQQLKDVDNQAPINGGYFVFKREFLDLIPDDPKVNLENEPIDALVEQGELAVYHHKGFWQCMDTYRDNQLLEKMWKDNPVWKIW